MILVILSHSSLISIYDTVSFLLASNGVNKETCKQNNMNGLNKHKYRCFTTNIFLKITAGSYK